MVLTDKKVRVTFEMLTARKMLSDKRIAVFDPLGKIEWKCMMQLTDEDFDQIESLFLDDSHDCCALSSLSLAQVV